MPITDDWGGEAVADEWGGIPVEQKDDWGGIRVQQAAPIADAAPPSAPVAEQPAPSAGSSGSINWGAAGRALIAPFTDAVAAAAELKYGIPKDKTLAQSEEDMRTPIVTFPKPSGSGVVAGTVRGLANVGDQLTTPENVILLAAGAGAPSVVNKIAAAGFGTQMATALPDQVRAVGEAKTPGEKAEKITELTATAAMTGLAAKHVAGRAPISAVERSASMSEARAKVAPETIAPLTTEVATEAASQTATPARSTPTPEEAAPLQAKAEPVVDSAFPDDSPAGRIRQYISKDLKPDPEGDVTIGGQKFDSNDVKASREIFLTEASDRIEVATEKFEKVKDQHEELKDDLDMLMSDRQFEVDRRTEAMEKMKTATPDELTDLREEAKLASEGIADFDKEASKLKAKIAVREKKMAERQAEVDRATAEYQDFDKAEFYDPADAPKKSAELPEGYVGGPGAMGPVEAAEMQAANRVTGTKNERMRLEREARGEEELIREQPVSNREAIDRARDALAENPSRGQEIVERLKNSPQDIRNISAADEAVLMAHKVELMKQRAEQERIYGDGNRSPEEHAVAAQRIAEIEGKMNEVDQATYASGAEWGRLGQLRQRLLREDYSLEAMERKARFQKGETLTPEETAKIKQQSERIAELEKQLEEATKKRTDKESETAINDTVASLKKKAKPGKPIDLEVEGTKIERAINERIKDGDAPEDLRDFVQRLALNLVRRGVTEREALIDRVHSVLQPMGLDRTQTRDLISGYGDFRPLDKEPAKVTLRGLKGEMQQLGKIEDMQAKQAPKKTGMERRGMTDEERRLQKEVNELKRKGGFQITDPATQLKTAMEAIKTRLRNEIRDLDSSIATHERLPEKKSQVEYDAEATTLKQQRDVKRAQYDELFPKEPMTQEQQIARTTAALDRSIAQLEADLRAGKLYGNAGRKLTSPEIEAKRARLAALQEERNTMRDLDTATIEAKKESALLKSIENAQKTIPERKEGSPTVDSERVTELKRALQEARDARASSPEVMKAKLDAAADSARKSIAEYDRRLREGDTSPRSSTGEPLRSSELDNLRMERDALERAYREMVSAEKPKKSREEIALQAYKTRTANRIAELEERMAKGDFDPRPRPEPPKLDRGALDLKAKITKVKREYDQQLRKYQLDRRSKLEKAMSIGLEIMGSVRGVILGSDIGILARQGLFAWSRPVTALRATGQAFKSAFSPEAMGRWEVEIRDREINGRSAAQERKKAGLRITDTLDHPEELVVTRLLSRIPDIEVAGRKVGLSEVGRTLERFQTTFINAVRADLFDSAIKHGFTHEELQLRANFINSATGSSNVKYVPKAMSAIFTSPRYEASRWEMLAQPVRNIVALSASGAKGKLNRAALENLRDMGVTVAGIYGIFQLAQASGYSVNWNPTSSDFLKMRKGNEVWDVSAGLAPRIRDVMRMFVAITHPSYKDNIGKVLTQTIMRAVNPALKTSIDQGSVAYQRSQGNTKPSLPFSGFKSDEEREGWITLAPLIVQSAIDAIKEDASSAAFSILREFVGTSVNRYPEKK